MKIKVLFQNFIIRTQDIVNALRSQGEFIIEQIIVEKIMRSLHPKYDLVVITIEERNNLTTVKVVELVGSF
jgi:hypothetical protein